MTMIAVGQGLRGIANRGMSAVSRAETVEEQQRMGIEAQEQAAESQLLGTGAGIGGMVGAKAAMGLKAGEVSQGMNNVASTIDGIAKTADAAKSLSVTADAAAGAELGGAINNVGTTIEGLSTGAEVLSTGAEVGGAINNVAGALEVGAGATEAVAAGTELAAASNAAAASAGPMAQLSALAGPVAIGLGVAFLLNKLF
mgnify:FL=1